MNKIFKTLDDNYILYGRQRITVLFDNSDDIWFNAKQTALSLGYSYTRDAIKTNVNRKDVIQLKYIDLDLANYKGHPQTLYLSESGLYSLMFRSRMKQARMFTEWVTSEVLPSIRKYGSYKLKRSYETEKTELLEKIKYLEKERNHMKSDMKKEKYPNGALVYVIDYSTDDEKIYRIGKTNNMKLRKQVYNTHTLHKHSVVFMKECKCPTRLERCLRIMLYKFRYKNNKDFYVCELNKIKNGIAKCLQDFKQMDEQKGGSKTRKKYKTGFELYLVKELRILHKEKQRIDKRIAKLTGYLHGI